LSALCYRLSVLSDTLFTSAKSNRARENGIADAFLIVTAMGGKQ
jgi:hypothetical protein